MMKMNMKMNMQTKCEIIRGIWWNRDFFEFEMVALSQDAADQTGSLAFRRTSPRT
jgi:hypothetical protein